jgi:GTP:adenosylcobinamide-phosphate guanylyltransferase
MNKKKNLIILPAGGNATRIGGAPKFLLPTTNKGSMLLHTLDIISSPKNNVWISTKPEYGSMVHAHTKTHPVNIKVAETSTMSEAINEYKDFNSPVTILMMPDTYTDDKKIIDKIEKALKENDVAVCVWKIQEKQKGKLGQCLIDKKNNILNVVDKDKDCPYEYAWGVIGWKDKFWKHIDNSTTHIGYALNPAIKSGLKVKAVYMDGLYRDCGTIGEYLELLNNLDL